MTATANTGMNPHERESIARLIPSLNKLDEQSFSYLLGYAEGVIYTKERQEKEQPEEKKESEK